VCPAPAHGHVQGQLEPAAVWLLIQWPTEAEALTKRCFSILPKAGVWLRRLAELAKLRWRVEEGNQHLKEELGLGHYEGRGRQGSHLGVILLCMAYA